MSSQPELEPVQQEMSATPPKEDRGNAESATASLEALCASVIERLGRFDAQFSDHLRNTAACSQGAFNQLYDEMQGYKKNFLKEAQRPLLMDLMLLYDSIDNLLKSYQGASSVDPEILRSNLSVLLSETEEMLGRSGIERMIATSDKLNVSLQRAIKTVPTDNPEEHLTVIEHLKAGFLSDDKAFRKEQVVIRTCAKGVSTGADTPAGEERQA